MFLDPGFEMLSLSDITSLTEAIEFVYYTTFDKSGIRSLNWTFNSSFETNIILGLTWL